MTAAVAERVLEVVLTAVLEAVTWAGFRLMAGLMAEVMVSDMDCRQWYGKQQRGWYRYGLANTADCDLSKIVVGWLAEFT